jgi:hypothetical protein
LASPSPSPVLALPSPSPAALEPPKLPAANTTTAAANATIATRPATLPANVTVAAPRAAATAATGSAASGAIYFAESPLFAIQVGRHLLSVAHNGAAANMWIAYGVDSCEVQRRSSCLYLNHACWHCIVLSDMTQMLAQLLDDRRHVLAKRVSNTAKASLRFGCLCPLFCSPRMAVPAVHA